MFHTVLVPLDGSAFAEQALPWAVSIAGRANAKLDLVRAHLLYALDVPAYDWAPYDPAVDADFRIREQRYLEHIAQHVRDEAIKVDYAVGDGTAAAAILAQAREMAANLIVMATHGNGPLSRAFLGSVADKLLRRSPVPILLVRPEEALPNLHDPPSLGRVVIPLDGSSISERILGPAAQLCLAMRAPCTLFHVVAPDLRPAAKSTSDRNGGLNRSCQEHQAEDSLAYLDKIAERLRARSLDVQTRVVISAHAAAAIHAEASAEPNSAIALATHGRGGFKRLLLGSVADKVVRGASCPVLVCRESTERER